MPVAELSSLSQGKTVRSGIHLLRAGELTFVWVPDKVHEAMRDLVRARQAASLDVRKVHQRIQSFLLKEGRSYSRKPWGYNHRVWLADQSFARPTEQIAFQSLKCQG